MKIAKRILILKKNSLDRTIAILTKMIVILQTLILFEDEEELDSSDDYLGLEFDEKSILSQRVFKISANS